MRTTELIGGVEVSVETGTATITALDPRPRNVGVTLKDPALETTLRRPLVGWLDRSDTEALALAEAAVNTGKLLSYRIEVHRDSSIDASLPMAQVPQTSRFRRLVSLVPAAAAGAPEPAPWDNLPPATNPVPAGSSGTRDEGGGGLPAATRPTTSAARSNARPGPRVQEAKPWEPTNTDGSPNLGSYESLAGIAMTELAHELMLARAAEAGHQVWSIDTMRRLARTLLVAADRVQAGVRADGHADRMDNSHSRARGAVRTALTVYPVPWEAGATEKAAWVESLVGWATDILRCGLELAGEPAVRGIPRTASGSATVPAGQETGSRNPVSGPLATEEERNAARVATRQVDDSDASRDSNGDTAYDRLAQWMHREGIPPLVSKKLTSEQATKVRAYLANLDGATGAAA